MEALNPMATTRCRTLWISDVHLGSSHCKAEYLLRLLDQVHCERLYLVGDIVDVWAMQKRVFWPEAHNQVLRKLLSKSRAGVEVFYIPGNHDSNFREFCDHEFGNVQLREQMVHTTADGKRLLVTHGDELDFAVRYSRLNRIVGDIAYEALMSLNRLFNRVRNAMGMPYWSLAGWVKSHVAQANRAIDAFEEAAVQMAREKSLDGVICGHLHQPRIRQYGEVLYCNDGDWVENCTALLEDFEGHLCLVRGMHSLLTEHEPRVLS